jgi:hypothetical protein
MGSMAEDGVRHVPDGEELPAEAVAYARELRSLAERVARLEDAGLTESLRAQEAARRERHKIRALLAAVSMQTLAILDRNTWPPRAPAIQARTAVQYADILLAALEAPAGSAPDMGPGPEVYADAVQRP